MSDPVTDSAADSVTIAPRRAADDAVRGPGGQHDPVFDLLSSVRAMRRLAPDPVPDDLLEELVRAASWAPSGGNGQGFRFVVVTDRERMARLAELWQVVVDWYLAGFGALVPPTMDAAAHARMTAAVRYQRDHFADTPALIVACHLPGPKLGPLTRFRMTAGLSMRRRLDAMRNTRLDGQEVNAASVYPAVQNLLVAARARGLGAALTSWHIVLEKEFKQVLDIPADVRTYALIPVGWPLGRFGPVRRMDAASLTHRDRWRG